MAYVQHLSVRVPWHDTGWTGTVCGDPMANSSCVMLDTIGLSRKPHAEAAQAGQPWSDLDADELPPCVMERGGFLSGRDHEYRRKHPYRYFDALTGLKESVVQLPAYSVHAVPYFWLHGTNVNAVLEERPIPGFDPGAEVRARKVLGDSKLQWVLHGDNQKAVIEAFFRNVTDGQSLVFFYLKHSPFEGQPRRMLVGAACVTGRTPPGRWPGSNDAVFPNHMWETVLRHTLRPDGTGGILLPVQELARLAAKGVDVTATLAAAPETGRNFSYATEHVSPDSTVAALMELERAVQAIIDLGEPSASVPEASRRWLDQQLRRAWARRGPTPGLPAVLEHLRFLHPTFAAHRIISEAGENNDPWPLLERMFEGSSADGELGRLVTGTARKIWANKTAQERQMLRLLSRFDLTSSMADSVLAGTTQVPIGAEDLLANPYDLVTCTVDDGEPIPFETVDRGCFPDHQITTHHPLPVDEPLDDPNDTRRIDAAMTSVLLRAEEDGHTLLPLEQMAQRLEQLTVTVPFDTGASTLGPLGLLPASLEPSTEESGEFLQLRRVDLPDGDSAYKLLTAAHRRDFIRGRLNTLRDARPHVLPADLSRTLDRVLDAISAPDGADPATERRARKEKGAAFRTLYSSRLSVLNGPAGTGKTTLVKALVDRPEVQRSGILLVAPTGKARVQLQNKVGWDAFTLAQFLAGRNPKRYDGEGRYRTPGGDRLRVGTVVVDEASMLTEQMLAALLDAVEITQRLVLVGDPRQLPPIGAGRPFVDLERRMQPEEPVWPRAGHGWAELTVTHRQHGHERDDLALARWYSGDDLDESADEVWEKLRLGQGSDTLRTVAWEGRTPAEVLEQVLREEFGVTDHLTFARSYGAVVKTSKKGKVYPDFTNAVAGCDRWQILSPVRGRAHGTADLNRHLKSVYRERAFEEATSRRRWSPKPFGPEQIVLGDKVVNNRNQYLYAQPKPQGKDDPRRYVANGELGVVTGDIDFASPPWATKVEFSSQPDWKFTYRKGGDDSPLELAWALTVHKSQGSEFGTVVLMLPENVRGISRELLYTALTRQTDRIIICHEGSLEDLMDLGQPTASDVCRRLTDLITPSRPALVRNRKGEPAGVVDRNFFPHLSRTGIPVRSKNEVIIADLLQQLAPNMWEYERPLRGRDSKKIKPDFTIDTDDPDRPIYWEHLGRLDNAKYVSDWEWKLNWYAENGILPAPDGGHRGILVVTDDRGGVNEPQWEAQFKAVFTTEVGIQARTVQRRPRRPRPGSPTG
ncbi:AAA family ATPase [Kitasatospora sp. NPDC048365]|uniref:AAA family ATPase n=1 Tax=Kitasatospora sp. NPDC048365 TaxID=3364050 RepID=UPI0037177B05